jgi:xanthine/CO dehydrogenase XdhC/CoxF family maturation factor
VTELQSIVRELIRSDVQPAVLCTLVTVEGSSYRRPGARLLLTSDHRKIGSISGGCLEEDLILRATSVTYDTTNENDLVWGVGLGCHGIVRVLIEKLEGRASWAEALSANFAAHRTTELSVVWQSEQKQNLGTHLSENVTSLDQAAGVFRDRVPPPTRLIIFGAGDDAQPVSKMAKALGWHVTIADPRANLATPARFAEADNVVVGSARSLVDKINPPADAVAVVMTHHYVHDLPLLSDLLKRPLSYLGLLGPKKRARQIVGDIRRSNDGAAAPSDSHLHAPVGLDLGAENPEEVALSIIAEIKATLAGRDAQPLRLRDRPIHG